MKKFQELRISSGSSNFDVISFGEADTDSEIFDTYGLRYDVYSKKGYINQSTYKTRIEFDEYDELKKCRYFIAKYKNKIIGTIRMITDNPLPTEKYFSFKEPRELSDIKNDRLCEFGRFIIVPPDENKYFPRGIIMLFMFNLLNFYALSNGYKGGYSFVKRSLLTKMNKFKMPVGQISSYDQVYNEGVLLNYFNQVDDPVIPIFFTVEDFNKYLNKKINNSWLFKKEEGNIYILRSNLLIDFLKKINII